MNERRSGLYNLGDILQLPAHGERSAIVDLRDESRTRELSAFELDALCDGVGRGLLRRGIRPGARIGILAENRLEFVASYFGIMRMGAVAVPVNHKLPRATIAELERRGHIVEVGPDWSEGRLTAASRDGRRRRAAANPRGMQGYAAGR